MTTRTFEPPDRRLVGTTARRGARLALVTATVEQVTSVGTTLVLARILSPRDFGVVAAANVILGLLAIATQLGFGHAVVKRQSVDERAASTLWWSAAAVGATAALVMVATSPWLARAFGIRVAGPFIAILAPLLFLRLTINVARALLQRQLEFGRIYRVELVVAVVYAVLQIGLALAGAGAYAVVVGQVGSVVCLWLLMHRAARWLPRPVFDRELVRSELGFSAAVFANMTLSWASKNVDYIVVGRIGDARRLGLYYVAYVLPNILRQRLTWTATEVLYPVLTRVREDRAELRAAYLRMLQLMSFAGFPLMAGVALTAPWVVRVFFGDQWRSAFGPMRVLAMAALVEVTTQAVTTVFLADGTPQRSARIEAVRLGVLVPVLAAAAATGSIVAIAGAVLAANVVAGATAQVLLCRTLEMRLREPVRAVLPVAVPTTLMAAAVLVVDAVTDPVAMVDGVMLVGVGAGAFFAFGFTLFPRTFGRLLREVQQLARGRS